MAIHDDLGTRMKGNYEMRSRTYLTRRMPVILRLDGCHFHTFTRNFQKPFDTILMKSMQETMKYLCENIQGAVFAYTQSDEITLILVDYQNLNSEAWFDYRTDKICSVAASMATMAFNKAFKRHIDMILLAHHRMYSSDLPEGEIDPEERFLIEEYGFSLEFQNSDGYWDYIDTLQRAEIKGAIFDCRCFNIPKEEVANLVYWRQLDAIRNSVQMVGQANFSQKELDHKSCENIKQMLIDQKNINWNDYPIECQRGTACIKESTTTEETFPQKIGKPRIKVTCTTKWIIDKAMPIIKDDRNYVEQHILVGE